MFDWSNYRLFVLNRGWKPDSLQMMIFVYVFTSCSVVEQKKRYETWIKRNFVIGVIVFHLSYSITLTTYLCSQCDPNIQFKYFMFDSTIYRFLVLNRGWKLESHQLMLFVYVCSTWIVVDLKPKFETWRTRNFVNGVNLFHHPYLITLTTYLYWQWATKVQIKYFIFDWSIYILFVLNRVWKRDSLQMMIFVYVYSTCSVFGLKTRFETWREVKCVHTSHIS
jgi:hypothetical protein